MVIRYFAPMGRHDNRRSMKMRRRKRQRKLKGRIKRRAAEKRAVRTPTGSATKPRASKKAAAKE